MPSFLPRLWKRTTSTVFSSPTEVTAPPPTTPSTQAEVIPPTPFVPPVDRKILLDPDSLLTSFTEEPEEVVPPAVVGLKPRMKKGPLGALRKSSVQPAPKADDSEGQTLGGISTSPGASMKGAKGNNRFMSRLSQLSMPGEWSTFGRQRVHVSPALGDFGEPHATSSDVHARDSIEARSSNISHPSTPPHTTSTPSQTSPAHQDSSPSGMTSSSNKTPKTPDRPRSRSGSRSSASRSFITTPPSRDLGHESPQTFGHPTPPGSRMTGLFGLGLGGTSSPPPMPALDHPALSSRSKSPTGTTGQAEGSSARSTSPPGSPPARTLFPDELQSTYPPHQQSSQIDPRVQESGGGTSSLLPLTFGNQSRSHSNLPKVQQIFSSHSSSEGPLTPARTSSTPRSASTRSRPSTGSSKKSKRKERRLSADWNAYQATEEFGWPALVSKEILRLSLGEERAIGTSKSGGFGAADPGCHPNTRAENVPDVPYLALESSATSVPAPSPHRSPSLGHPISFEGCDVDGNLSGHQADQHHGRFISGEVEEWSMPTKDSNRTETTISKKEKAVDPSTPLASTSDPRVSSPASLQIPPSLSITSPTPETSSFPPSASVPAIKSSSALQIPAAMMKTPTQTPSDKSKGKRKADDSNITPPDQKKEAQHTTFAPVDIRALRVSDSSRAPSSYQNKRARISSPPQTTSQSKEVSASQQATNYGSWSSRASSRSPPHHNPTRTPSRAASSRSASQQQHQQHHHQVHRASSDRRKSMSQISIPISALVSPHAPSISRSSKFHMQDPRKPPRKRDTGWALRFREDDEPGSPIHAWFFFVGFVLFPLWWAASVMRTPKTRHVGGSDTEKAVPLDDPQIEYDAQAWRLRCRIMSIVSLFTYIPFVVLVAVFAPR